MPSSFSSFAFLQRALAVPLRRDEHPPAGDFLGAALREAPAQAERRERLLGARRIGDGEASPFHAGERRARTVS